MSAARLILVGAGGHARACIDVVEQQGQYAIAGLVGMAGEVGSLHCGHVVVAADADLAQAAAGCTHGLVAVGQIKSPDARIRIAARLRALGLQLPVIVAPGAHVSRHARIGAGTIVMHGAIVNAGAVVGENCIVNSRALIEHDAVVGSDCHVSTGAILNGGVRLGAGSFVGSGSIIKEGVILGQRCIVGMGQVVRHNQPDHACVTGTPR